MRPKSQAPARGSRVRIDVGGKVPGGRKRTICWAWAFTWAMAASIGTCGYP